MEKPESDKRTMLAAYKIESPIGGEPQAVPLRAFPDDDAIDFHSGSRMQWAQGEGGEWSPQISHLPDIEASAPQTLENEYGLDTPLPGDEPREPPAIDPPQFQFPDAPAPPPVVEQAAPGVFNPRAFGTTSQPQRTPGAPRPPRPPSERPIRDTLPGYVPGAVRDLPPLQMEGLASPPPEDHEPVREMQAETTLTPQILASPPDFAEEVEAPRLLPEANDGPLSPEAPNAWSAKADLSAAEVHSSPFGQLPIGESDLLSGAESAAQDAAITGNSGGDELKGAIKELTAELKEVKEALKGMKADDSRFGPQADGSFNPMGDKIAKEQPPGSNKHEVSVFQRKTAWEALFDNMPGFE